MALAQLGAVRTQNQRGVDIVRRLIAEGPIHQQMTRGGRNPLLAADNVSDFHGMVVNNISQVIGREAIRLQHHEIVDSAVLENDVPVDSVRKAGPAFVRHLKAHHGPDTFSFFAGALLAAQAPAGAVVAGRLFPGDLLLAHLLKSVGGAIAVIGIALRDKAVGSGLIEVESLRLKIGAIIAADLRSFIPVQTQPAQTLQVGFQRTGGDAGDIRILDAEDERAAGMTGKKPIEHSRAHIADLRAAGRTGGEADPDGSGHTTPFYHPSAIKFYGGQPSPHQLRSIRLCPLP